MRMYIAVLEDFPDYMTPTLVAHAILNAHTTFSGKYHYDMWLHESFKKCVVRVNKKEFDRIKELDDVVLQHENNTLGGLTACAVVCPRPDNPNVLRFAKLWKPKQ